MVITIYCKKKNASLKEVTTFLKKKTAIELHFFI